jgi:parvulin-like peptidyl-prolyl isomerase
LRSSPIRSSNPARRARAALVTLTLLCGFGLTAHAQFTPPQPPPTPPPAPPPSPVIARIEGRPITQQDFDRVAQPYFLRLREQMKEGFTEDVRKLANKNVLDELFRREILVIEAKKQNVPVTEAETDFILKDDPFFTTNGTFDQAKFLQYKLSPQSNYLTVLPKVREIVASAKLDSMVRKRSTPSPAAVRAEWAKRNDQVRFKLLPMTLRDVSLDPEATEAEQAAYYAAHPDQFERKPRVRFRYLKLPLPPEGDSLRAAAEADSMKRARGLAESLRRGDPIDTLAATAGGAHDSGLLEVPPTVIPELGRVPALSLALARADSDTTMRVVGPVVTPDAIVVGTVTERQPRTVPPMREIPADVKRRADAEKRKTQLDGDHLAYYQTHRDEYRGPRAAVTRVVLRESSVPAPKAPSNRDVERWYAAHGRSLLALADNATLPALDDSLREVARAQMAVEARAEAAQKTMNGVVSGWRSGRDVRSLARSTSAVVETTTFLRGGSDTLFAAAMLDSLLGGPAATRPGAIQGPRSFAARLAAWRVDALDTSFVPPYEAVKSRVDLGFQEEKRQKEEAEALAYYHLHRAAYKTKPKYTVEYVSVLIPPADSVTVPEADLRKYYNGHKESYREEEQVRARHILISSRTPAEDGKARTRADSLLRAIRGGADFGQLARTFSQDPGSGSQGGDLGFFPRGRMVKEFSDTAFALAPGQVSGLTKTQFGYHIIRVDEKKPAGLRPYEEVRGEIKNQLAQSRGDSTAMRTANSIRKKIVAGTPAAQAAAKAGGVKTSSPFAETDPVPELGMIQGLAQDLPKIKIGTWGTKVYRSGTAYVLIRPTQRVPPGPAEFAEVKTQAVDDMKNAKKKEILARRSTTLRTQLKAGASIDSVAAPYGGLKDSGFLNRSSGFVPFIGMEPRVIDKAFTLKVGTVSDTIQIAQSGLVWVRPEEKKTVQGASFAKDGPMIKQELTLKNYQAWVDQKRKGMKIEILRADLKQAPPPIQQTFTVGR